jgi:hypothetical protein
MYYLHEWLNGWMFAFFIGIFPAWWWFSADIICFSTSHNKIIPKWMKLIAKYQIPIVYFYPELNNKPFFPKVLRICTCVWVSVFLVLTHISFIVIPKAPFIDIVIIETSSSLGLLAFWLLPSYFLRRYLRRRMGLTVDPYPKERV